jgi:hypothetical protein
MDLIAILQKMWRHKLALIPVVALTMLGAVYIVALKPAMYSTTSNYILLSPPAPPTAAQVGADPALGRISANNPYMEFGDLSIVSSLLAQVVATDAVRANLVKQGAESGYTVAPSQQFGLTTPMLQITGMGATPQAAIKTTTLVGQTLVSEMDSLQAAKGVNPHYYITASQFTAPGIPKQQLSSKLRSLVAILAIGMLLTFIVLSVADGIAERKELARRKDKPHGAPGTVGIVTAAGNTVVAAAAGRETDAARMLSELIVADAEPAKPRVSKPRRTKVRKRPPQKAATPQEDESSPQEDESDWPSDWPSDLPGMLAARSAPGKADAGS